MTRRNDTDDELRRELARLDETLRRLEREVALARSAADEAAAPAAPPDPPLDRLFERRVELDAGPFADFDELSAFERTLAELAGVGEVYVRRFFDDRAIVELAAGEELPLLSILRGALPAFTVDYAEPAALKITLGSPLARTA